PDQAGDPTRLRRWTLRDRGAVGDPAGGLVQTARQTHLSDGAHPSSLRAVRMARAEGGHPFLDRGDHLCAHGPVHAEAAVETCPGSRAGAREGRMTIAPRAAEPPRLLGARVVVVGAARSGLALARFLLSR